MKNRKNRFISTILLCYITVTMAACGKEVPKYDDTFFAMDTVMNVSVYGDEDIIQDVKAYIADAEKHLSVTDTESDIYRLNNGLTDTVSDITYSLIKEALELCEKTDGALDITVYPILTEWGFTTDEKRVPDQPTLNLLLENIGYERVETFGANKVVLNGTMIDLGSVAKGYTSDAITDIIRNCGKVDSAIVTLGGNVQTVGKKPDGSLWRVAIKNPLNSSEYVGYVEVENKAVITSGAYERYFEVDGKRYYHIIDPKTGYPAESGLASVTIVGESGIYSDALSTALFVMGLDEAIDYYNKNKDFEAVFIDEEGKVYITKGLEKSFNMMNGNAMIVGE